MDTRSRAFAAVKAAIAEITDAARSALNTGRFDDAAWCARLADELSKLSSGDTQAGPESPTAPGKNVNGGELGPTEPGDETRRLLNERRTPKHNGHSTPQQEHVSEIDGYPLFYKDRDTLVKIGWSKSQGGEYEHRAPKAAVDSLAREVARVGKGKPTSMETLLPLRGERGGELPSYQAYLALAWLRACGAVQRHGQDGYSLTPEFADLGAIEKLWNRLTITRPRPKV